MGWDFEISGSTTNSGLIAQHSIDAVLQRSDLVDLVQGFTQLKKHGNEWQGRCPFHDERTPSFSVNSAKGVYYCFGCSASGDVIGFLKAKQGLDFVEAVEYLADRYRINLEYTGDRPVGQIPKRRLYELTETATVFYENTLWKSEEAARARAYCHERGISEETAKAFRMGYSPESRNGTSSKAKSAGYSEAELKEARIVASGGSDYFQGRLMIPIIDRAERVIGFGARKLRDEQYGGKYMNSADGRLFHKKQTIYLGPGVRGGARADYVIVVEGYMSVIALHQAGFTNVCATMGTALTDEQFTEIRRIAPKAYFAFDPDPAGIGATLRALNTASDHDLDLRVLELPEGQDPADVIVAANTDGGDEAGRALFQKMLDRAATLLEWRISYLLNSEDLNSSAGKNKVYKAARELFNGVAPSPERSVQIDRVADRLQIRDPHLIASLGNDGKRTPPKPQNNRGGSSGYQSQGGGRSQGGNYQSGGNRSQSGNYPSQRGNSNASGGSNYSSQSQGFNEPSQLSGRPPRRADPAVRDEKLLLAAAICLVEGKEVTADSLDIDETHLTLDVHRRFLTALNSTSDKPLDISRIHSDSEMVGLVAELTALREREYLDTNVEHARNVLNELRLRLKERWLSRAIADLKEAHKRADDDAELLATKVRLESERRTVRAQLRDTPDEE